MPAVTVRSSPNGLPIATTASPTSTLSESASVSGVRARARGVDLEQGDVGRGSLPTSVAFSVSSFEKRTSIEVAPSIDVVVRDDVPLLVEHEAGAERLRRLLELTAGRGSTRRSSR